MEEKNYWVNTAEGYSEEFPTVYVLMQSTGTYEDRFESPLDVYECLEDAEEFIDEQEQWKQIVEATAIKPDEHSYADPYALLEQAFREHKWNTLFPGKDMNDMTLEEEDEYFASFDDDGQDFVEWLVNERGLERDVAECTVIWNAHHYDEQHPLNATYYIIKTNLIKKGYKE